MTLPVAAAPVVHRRPVEGEADSLLRLQRAMLWLRLAAIVVVVSQGWLYEMVQPALLWAAVAIDVVVVAGQARFLGGQQSLDALRRRAIVLLAADMLSVYLIGTAFARDEAWSAYYYYPMLSLEGAIIAGVWGGASVTATSVIVYLGQLVLHVTFGNEVELRSALASVSQIAIFGMAMSIYAHGSRRGSEYLRTLLHLTSALARHEHQADAIRQLDAQLHAAVGARIRSVAIREPDGSYRVTRWRTGEDHLVTPEALLRAFPEPGVVTRRLEAGDAVTVETDAWSVVTAALALPEWACSITLVPIVAEGRWVGVLPVLWPTRTVPDEEQLRLLYGLAGQMGLALARGELEQMRRDALVDPLTGLLNRRAIGAELKAFVARASRANGRLAIVLLQVGAVPGDARTDGRLRAVAAAVRDELRNGDVAGRLDDDEVLVIAADADTSAAGSLAARISRAIARVAADSRLAVGVAAYPDDGPTGNDLIEAAEAVLAVSEQPPSMGDDAAGEAEEAAVA